MILNGKEQFSEAIFKMSEGNIGAVIAMTNIVNIDIVNGLNCINTLSELDVSGSRLYVLWSDCCERDDIKFMKVINAVRNKYIDKDFIDCHINSKNGRGIAISDFENKF